MLYFIITEIVIKKLVRNNADEFFVNHNKKTVSSC